MSKVAPAAMVLVAIFNAHLGTRSNIKTPAIPEAATYLDVVAGV